LTWREYLRQRHRREDPVSGIAGGNPRAVKR
jgi:hypothetical protein